MDINNLNFQANEVGLRTHLTEKCPRCNSLDTKFCYYNNYSLNQPRHFCKTCRRYWTQGGICRNIPIGGSSYHRNRRGTETRPRASFDPNIPTFVRRRRRLRNTGSITLSGGRGRGRINPMGINFPNESSFGPMQLLSFNNNFVNVNNNVVAPMFGTFGPPPPPPLIGGGSAWPLENMLMTADPNENIFLWGLDGVGGSGSSNGSASNGPPPPHFSCDIDVINDQWLHDLPEYIPSLPPAT